MWLRRDVFEQFLDSAVHLKVPPEQSSSTWDCKQAAAILLAANANSGSHVQTVAVYMSYYRLQWWSV